jgi:hypothetical protein
MSRLRKGAVPTYRLHKARNCAVVTIDGHDHYLGPFGTPSSKQRHAGLIRAWQQRQEQPPVEPDGPGWKVSRPRSTSSAPPAPSGCVRRPAAMLARHPSTPPTSGGCPVPAAARNAGLKLRAACPSVAGFVHLDMCA